MGSDYYIFKEGIRPMWEDTANKAGGRWTICKHRSKDQRDLDLLWRDLVGASLLIVIDESNFSFGFECLQSIF